MSCKQEWFEELNDRWGKAVVDAMAGGTADEKRAAALLGDEVREIEEEIESLGGTPGEPDAGPNDAGPEADGGSASADQPSSQGAPAGWNQPEPDAISGVGELLTDDLGTWDLSWTFSWVADLIEGVHNGPPQGPCPKGTFIHIQETVNDTHSGSSGNGCF